MQAHSLSAINGLSVGYICGDEDDSMSMKSGVEQGKYQLIFLDCLDIKYFQITYEYTHNKTCLIAILLMNKLCILETDITWHANPQLSK